MTKVDTIGYTVVHPTRGFGGPGMDPIIYLSKSKLIEHLNANSMWPLQYGWRIATVKIEEIVAQ